MEPLARALPTCNQLALVDLDSNALGDEAATLIAEALPSCATLRELSLGDNEISSAGCHMLAAALCYCPTLRCLRLDANEIGDDGGTYLAGALMQCNLEELYILDCGLGVVSEWGGALRAFAKVITTKSNRIKLKKLDVSENGCVGIPALQVACKEKAVELTAEFTVASI